MVRVFTAFSFFACVFFISLQLEAAIDVYRFDTESQRQRYHTLIEEMRCPKCQNQNLAGSNSQIAADLRRELHRLILEGKTDREIKSFMVDRYGDFVLYQPPLHSSTLMLWFFPGLLVVVGALILALIVRNNRRAYHHSLNNRDRSKIKHFLDENSDSL